MTDMTRPDVVDAGTGPAVVLLHSSVSGNRQWRRLTDDLTPRFRVLAINLLGYGSTPSWPGARPQTLDDQTALVHAALAGIEGPVGLVGHSFGGAVAMRAAVQLGGRVGALVLLEPNPFTLLARDGRFEAFAEACALRDTVQQHGRDWLGPAERFADYWLGDGSWAAMPESRRTAFAAALAPNVHEWDAVTDPDLTLDDVATSPAPTLLVSDPATRRTVGELAELLAAARPDWTVHHLPEGGHMAPLTRPDLVNPVVAGFLERLRG